MATNPYFSPLHTQRFSFIGSPQQRDGTYLKDQRFLNMYPELIKSPMTDGKKYYLKKRPGFTQGNAVPAGEGRGIFYWQDVGFFFVVGNIVYMQTGAGTVSIIALTTSSGYVGMCQYRVNSVNVLVVVDGIHGYTVNTFGTATQITDANFPSPHVPNPVFLDGYLFLAHSGTQTIHNSELSDPTTWPADGFIDAEMYPDGIVALTKAQNYLVAIGTESCEFFYDNANATGSPLQRNAPAVAQIGCPAPNTVNQTEKETIFVGQTNNGGFTCWVIDGFSPTEIATEPIREALDQEGTNLSIATANTIQTAGHKFYVLTLSFSQRTLVYDFEEKMWHEWSNGLTQQAMPWRYATDTGSGKPVWLHYANGFTAVMDPTVYTDLGGTINCQVTTSKIDFDSIERKRFFRLSLVTDAPNGDLDVPMIVDWSDDDYNTWVGNRTIEVNASYPTITQLGISRRRAFRFTYTQPYPLRMESFELDITQEVRR